MSELKIASSFRRYLEQKSKVSKVAERLLNPEFVNTKFGNFLSLKAGMIGYMPAGKTQEINEDGTWARSGRQHARAARVARKLLNEKGLAGLTDKDFEIFSNIVFATEEKGKISIVCGEDIRCWYHYRKYSGKNTGSLSESCMRYDRCQPYLDIYTSNKNVVSMVIMTDEDDLLIGRALLWESKGKKFMDRIYGDDTTIETFRNYASDNGWYYRKYNTYHDETWWVDFKGREVEKNVEVKLEKWEFDQYPYMDTFKYLYPGCVKNYDNDAISVLTSTDGGGGEDRVWSDYHDRYILREDSVDVPGYGIVHIDVTRTCEYCGDLFHEDDLRVGENGNMYCYDHSIRLHDGSVYSQSEIDNDNIVYVQSMNEYALIDDCMICEHCNEYFFAGQETEVTDSNGVSHLFCCDNHADMFLNSDEDK